MNNYIIKDSGKRVKFDSGFQRDTNEDKPRFDLIPLDVLTRLAQHYTNGAKKYDDNNWKLAKTDKEINRFKESAWRHFVKWSDGVKDEDHMAAAIWNIMSYCWHTEYKNEK